MTIIVTMLGALISVGNISLASSENLLARSQAAYLAQEGIEIVRQTRDTNWIDKDNSTQWDSLFWQSNNLVTQPVTDCAAPYFPDYNKTKDRWGLASGLEKVTINGINFYRSVNLCRDSGSLLPAKVVPADNALVVKVTIQWSDDGISRTETSSELLTNWRPNF